MTKPAHSQKTDLNSNSNPNSDHAWKEFEIPFQTYPRGTELFQQGSGAEEVFCIDSGVVKLLRLEDDGQELIVDLRFARSLVGSAAVIMEEPHPVTAITLTPSCVRRIPATVFRCLLQKDVELSWRVHRMHSRKVYDDVNRIAHLGCLSARQRIEYLFIQLFSALGLNQHQKDITLPMLLRNREIAALVAVTPEYFSRVLRQMQKEQLIRIGKGHLIITDPERLWRPA